jgi:hypothetical protein
VLATSLQLHGYQVASGALLAAGAALFVALVPRLAVAGDWHGRGTRFLLSVSIFSIAVAAAIVGLAHRTAWLVDAAALVSALGSAAYLAILGGFDFSELLSGQGDQWIAGGAAAIGAVAWAQTATAATGVGVLSDLHGVLRASYLGSTALALAWLPVLVAAEVVSPRLDFHRLRWATVFPAGMYAVLSLTVGDLEGWGWLTGFGRVWIWVAVALWVFVAAGALRRAVRPTGTGSSWA